MVNFIPYDKLSKKEKRKIDLSGRRSWNGLNPSTRVADTDNRKYRRKPKYPDKQEY